MGRSRTGRGFALAAALALAACDAPRRRTGPTQGKFSSVTYRLEEEARNGRLHPISPTYKTPVDTRSELVLTFDEPSIEEQRGSDRAGPEWERLEDLLALVEGLAADYARLNAQAVDVRDEQAVEGLQAQVRAVDAKVQGLLITLLDSGLTQDQVRDILSGRFDGRERDMPYANLSRWIRSEIERLKRGVEEHFERRESAKVSVEARLDPVVGETRNIHIPDWDKIADGVLATQDVGTKFLTPGERRRLVAQLEAARTFKGFLEELGDADEGIRAGLSRLRERFSEEVEHWDGVLRAISESLDRGPQPTREILPPGARTASMELFADLDTYRRDVQGLQDLEPRLRALRDEVLAADADVLIDTLVDQGGLVDKLVGWAEDATAAVSSFENLGARFEVTLERTQALADALGAEFGRDARVTLDEGLDQALQEVQARLPQTVTVVRTLASVFGSKSLEVANGAATLASADADLVLRDLDDLPTARVNLEGLAEDDRLTLRLRFHAPDGEVVKMEDYALVAERMGWYRDVAGALIFARGDQGTGDATDWKPNVAAMVSWHYQYREPQGGWQGFWNSWNPGLGLHVATLDQGDDNVELGIGVNVSLWDRYLYGGVGWNLNVDDDSLYYFIGSNLFEVLNAVRSGVGGY